MGNEIEKSIEHLEFWLDPSKIPEGRMFVSSDTAVQRHVRVLLEHVREIREVRELDKPIEITVPLPDSFEPGPIEWRQVISYPVDVSEARLVPPGTGLEHTEKDGEKCR